MSKLPIYQFKDIAINCTEKVKAEDINISTYIGLEHLDSGSLSVSRWGSDVPIKGEKLVMHKGDVLFGKRNTYLRRAAIAPHDGAFSAHGMVLRPKENVIDKEFFPLFIASDYFFDAAIRISVGSLSPTVNWKDLKDLEFYIPTIPEQQELSKILWAINDTKEAYKKLLQETDELVKARFVEMFGSIEDNPYHWKASTVGSECYYIKDGPHKSPRYLDGPNGIPFISTRNVVNGDGIDWSTAKYISEQDYEECIKKCHPEKGDILYSKGGTTGIAKLVTTDRKFANWVHVAVLKFGDQLDGRFFECMLNSDYCYAQSQRLTKGIANRDFVLSAIAQVKIFVPPIELQRKYTEFVQQVDKSKFELSEAIKELDAMYKRIVKDNLG